MRRNLGPIAGLAIAVLALAGCGDDAATGSGSDPSVSSSASADSSPPEESSSSEPTDFPSGSPGAVKTYADRPVPANLPRVRVEAANLHYAYLGRNAATTAEEKAVVHAWMSYWQGTADTYYLQRPTALFTSVARGRARSTVLDYMSRQKADGKRVAGYTIENILSVRVDGDSATLRDCTKSFTFTVDRESEPLSAVTPYYDTTGSLKRSGGTWTVVDYRDKARQSSCLG